jgi:hypothetical protein
MKVIKLVKRRKYVDGKCQDCGHPKRVAEIIFWATGMKYRVCSECIKPYRGVILKP